MKNCLKINKKMIIRDEDRMVFSSKNMEIYRFNEKGFKIVELLNQNNLSKDELFLKIENEFSLNEYNNLIEKMFKYNILEEVEI